MAQTLATLQLTFDPRDLPIGDRHVRTGATRAVLSPYDGRELAQVGWADAALARDAVDTAAEAMRTGLSLAERAGVLDEAARLIAEREPELASIISAEAGKPIATARIEAQRARATFQAAAVAARTLAGDVVPLQADAAAAGKLAFTLRVPAGVVGAVTPFNFPLNLVAHKVAPAIAAGCAVVLKPASKTPLSALALAHLLRDAGLAPGWLNVVVGPAAELVDAVIDDARVRVISFTGSPAVGWDLRRRANQQKVMLELGNATPAIVCADADLAHAAARVAATGFAYSGQSCVSVQRVLVQRAAYDEFARLLLDQVSDLRAGDPADESTTVGPVIDSGAHDRILEWIDEAQQGGAELLAGGRSLGNQVIEPTVLGSVTPQMRVSCEEVFGPVVALSAFDSLDEAFDRANGTDYGLQAGMFTSSLQTGLAAAERLQFGSVLVNESPSFRADLMPYGGVKSSGTGKEGPLYAVREMTEERLVILDPGPAAS